MRHSLYIYSEPYQCYFVSSLDLYAAIIRRLRFACGIFCPNELHLLANKLMGIINNNGCIELFYAFKY